MMIRRSLALRLGAILSVLAIALSGCVSEVEPSDADMASIDESSEELAAPSSGGSGSSSDDGEGAPSNPTTLVPDGEVVPDPLPWREVLPSDGVIRMAPGPDPLPWVPPGDRSAGSSGSGKKD